MTILDLLMASSPRWIYLGTFIKSTLIDLTKDVHYAYFMGNGIEFYSWKWKIYGSFNDSTLSCLLALHGEHVSRMPTETLLPRRAPFFLLPFVTFTLWLGLLLCSFAFVFPWCSSSHNHSCSPAPLPLLVPEMGENTAHLFDGWRDEQQIVQPLQLHIPRLSMSSSFGQSGEMKTLLAGILRTELEGYLMTFLKFRKEQLSLCWAFLLLLCFPFLWFLFLFSPSFYFLWVYYVGYYYY